MRLKIVEAVLDGWQPVEMGLDDLLEGFPLEWAGKVQSLGQSERPSGALTVPGKEGRIPLN